MAKRDQITMDFGPGRYGDAPPPAAIPAMAPRSTMPRPFRYDPAIVRAAAEAFAPELAEWDGSAESWVEPLVRTVHDWGDAYELAKALERAAHVQPDGDLVELLGNAYGHLDDAHARAERLWVRIVGFSPAFAVGDQVVAGRYAGPVHSIDLARARYVIDYERRGNGGVYMDAEKVVRAEEAMAA